MFVRVRNILLIRKSQESATLPLRQSPILLFFSVIQSLPRGGKQHSDLDLRGVEPRSKPQNILRITYAIAEFRHSAARTALGALASTTYFFSKIGNSVLVYSLIRKWLPARKPTVQDASQIRLRQEDNRSYRFFWLLRKVLRLPAFLILFTTCRNLVQAHMEPSLGIEPRTSSLPMKCSTN